jgi:hypothetical protein
MRKIALTLVAVYTIGPIPGSQPTHQPYALFRDGVVVPVAVPAEPSPWQWIVYPELAQQQQAERDAAIALNATVERELRRLSNPADFDGSGVVDSQDYYTFYTVWYTTYAGGQP